jgi:hypothetical protein
MLKTKLLNYIQFRYRSSKALNMVISAFLAVMMAGYYSISSSDFTPMISKNPPPDAVEVESPVVRQLSPPVRKVQDHEMKKLTPAPGGMLATSLYQDSEGFFIVPFPSSWSVKQTGSVTSFSSPDEKASMHISCLQTGYPLDAESFSRLVDAREANLFGIQERYFEVDHQTSPEQGSAEIEKHFSVEGVNTVVLTGYRQAGPGVFVLDFWSDGEVIKEYQTTAGYILENFTLNETTIDPGFENMALAFTFENENFSIQLPQYWRFQQTSSNQSMVSTFTSPDERAIVQTILYDDGRRIPDKVAGEFVLTVLRNFYAKDVLIYSDRFLPNGQEELSWKSSSADYQGTTLFDTRDSTLLVLTVMCEKDFTGTYQELLDQIVETYHIQP